MLNHYSNLSRSIQYNEGCYKISRVGYIPCRTLTISHVDVPITISDDPQLVCICQDVGLLSLSRLYTGLVAAKPFVVPALEFQNMAIVKKSVIFVAFVRLCRFLIEVSPTVDQIVENVDQAYHWCRTKIIRKR